MLNEKYQLFERRNEVFDTRCRNCLKREDLHMKSAFDELLKIKENLKHMRFVLNKINPSIAKTFINKACIVLVSPYRMRSWTENIR